MIRKFKFNFLILTLSIISTFSLGFASFLLPNEIFIEDDNDYNFSFGDVSNNVLGVSIVSNSFDGLKYLYDSNFNYTYLKTNIEVDFSFNKELFFINETETILNIKVNTNNNFFNSVNINKIEFYFDNLSNVNYTTNDFLVENSDLSINFDVNSSSNYDLIEFINRANMNQNDVILTLSIDLNITDLSYTFNQLYKSTSFNYVFNG